MRAVGRLAGIALAIGASAWLLPALAFGAEHGGKEQAGTTTKEHGGAATQEHGGLSAPTAVGAQADTTQEHGGTTQEHGGQALMVEPSAEQIRQAISDYIALIELEEEAFTIEDDVTGTVRTLQLVRVHERVGKTGELHYSCTDMQDTSSGEVLDLDFDVDASGDQLEVVDVRIHKVEGQARYTYDEHDNRISLQPAEVIE